MSSERVERNSKTTSKLFFLNADIPVVCAAENKAEDPARANVDYMPGIWANED